MSNHLYALFIAQGGDCFYCGRPTWFQGNESARAAKVRLGEATRSAVGRRQATREHLRRKAEGGSDNIENLVMACQSCNGSRRETPVLLHLASKRAEFA